MHALGGTISFVSCSIHSNRAIWVRPAEVMAPDHLCSLYTAVMILALGQADFSFVSCVTGSEQQSEFLNLCAYVVC